MTVSKADKTGQAGHHWERAGPPSAPARRHSEHDAGNARTSKVKFESMIQTVTLILGQQVDGTDALTQAKTKPRAPRI